MQSLSAVIFAAGKGTRLEPLTTTTPKPLIKIAGKGIIWHNMDILCKFVSEFVLVVGCMAGEFRSVIGESYRGILVRYVVQEQQLGTADALKCAKAFISHDRFFCDLWR